MMRFSVTRRAHQWAVMDGDKLVKGFGHKIAAEECAERLDRAQRQRPRRCLTCGQPFISEGPHNRMCAACRQQSLYDGTA